eukprot:CAMPEP_0178898388 /NCGR_PEP_ID=MMETSP0786-20121207/2304_1 /TAXON_ID=186022 /ORGANISM="Thalassionema frauenfeldii, Strain CCMP 1798" /LENGTH=457 /DNA_ID=CAMNT_0020569103 /DNA_START=55 /DNA_END=1426 /DNA_ORIENTATION=-
MPSNQPDSEGIEGGNSSSVEHALLESLFYNEMMMMDESSSLSPEFMAYLSSNEGNVQGTPDAGAIAEKEMLRDFGVSSIDAKSSVPAFDELTPQPPSDPCKNTWPGKATVPNPVQSTAHNTSTQIPISDQTKPSDRGLSQVDSKDQTQVLISQFAVLARRLGISLPAGVVSSLAASVSSTHPNENLAALSGLIEEHTRNTSEIVQNENGACTAEFGDPSSLNNPNDHEKKRATMENSLHIVKDAKNQTYPNCESKLSALKAENEMLKRHLDTVTNRSKMFEQERKKQEDEMKRLMQEGSGPEKLNPLLKKYSENYSDYGNHRHQELTFHLDQLQRLIAPSDFTKMGLFTMGQNEKNEGNPIAGILRKELGITPQQGRKIVEQRQKIRDLTDNLKQCIGLLGKLKALCEHKQQVFKNRMSKCQEILNPLQVVKLLLWVDDHSKIMESTCPGWVSERIN